MKKEDVVVLSGKLAEFRHILEFMPDAIVIVDAKGIIQFVNSQAEKLFGYARAELVGQALEVLVPQRLHEAHVRNRTDYTADPHLRPMGMGLDLHARCKDGTEVPVEISLGPVKDSEGMFIMAAIRDVTERKRGDLKFQKLLELAPDAMVISDQNGKIVFLNSQTEKLFGYKKEELIHQPIEMLVPHRFKSAHVGHRTQYMKDPHVRPMGMGMDLYARRKDGTEIPVEISLGTMDTADGALVMAVIRDVTERKRVEEVLRKAQAEREILEVNEKTQQRIGQDLHDNLGQHLTAVTYIARLLQKKLTEKNIPESKEAEEILKLTSEAIGQVRGLARGLYPVELTTNGLVPALYELAESAERKYGIACAAQCNRSDSNIDSEIAVQLYRIAQEAVNNAAKHAHPRRITIELRVSAEKIFLAVRDDGVGFVPPAANAKGMGLHIMKYRADMIHASFEVKANEGGGTAILCSIPGSHG